MNFLKVLSQLNEKAESKYYTNEDESQAWERSDIKGPYKDGTWTHNLSGKKLGKLTPVSKEQFELIKNKKAPKGSPQTKLPKLTADIVYGGKQREGRGLGT